MGWRCGVVSLSQQGYERFEDADAPIIEWLNSQLLGHLNSDEGLALGSGCYHLKGRGGIKKAIQELRSLLTTDKTFIGKVERGFDFLGVQFQSGRLELSKVSMARLSQQLTHKFSSAARLYEQGRLHSLEKIELYLTHCNQAKAGWSKGIGIATSSALDDICQQLTEQCENPPCVMIKTFTQAMVPGSKHK